MAKKNATTKKPTYRTIDKAKTKSASGTATVGTAKTGSASAAASASGAATAGASAAAATAGAAAAAGATASAAAAKTKSSALKNLCCAICFLILAVAVFFYANTAIGLQGTTQNKGAYRAFDDLEKNTVDAVFIGSSATSRYVNPSQAYSEEGIASFVIGTQKTPVILVDNIMKYVQKTQKPKVFVIELRNVLKGYESANEVDVRFTTDSMKFYNKDRIEMINEALDVMKEHAEKGSYDEDVIDYYLPVVKYHTRLTSSKKKEAITKDELTLNLPYNKMQGFQCGNVTVTQVPQKNPKYETKSCKLDGDVKEVLDDLIDYCDTIDAEVLFTFSPYLQSNDKAKMTNAVTKYVEKRGYTCLNFCTEQMAEKLNINWQTDLYNNHHFNYLGAEKYTKYIAKYLKENYDLEDHSGDSKYDAWLEGYDLYKDYVADGIKHFEKSNVSDDE